MSYTSLLIDTCTIERFSEGSADTYGAPTLTWAAVSALTDIDCRLVSITGQELKIGAEIVVADYKLFLEDVTLTERDRAVISSITYEILLVLSKADGLGGHHKECLMRVSR